MFWNSAATCKKKINAMHSGHEQLSQYESRVKLLYFLFWCTYVCCMAKDVNSSEFRNRKYAVSWVGTIPGVRDDQSKRTVWSQVYFLLFPELTQYFSHTLFDRPITISFYFYTEFRARRILFSKNVTLFIWNPDRFRMIQIVLMFL